MATTKAMYNNFETHAAKIATYGSELHTNIKDAYTALAEVNNASGWQGELYDKLVESFNELVTSFNQIIKGVQYSIPSSIRYSASQFGGFDTQTVSNSTSDADEVTSIDKSNLDGLIYTPENVDSLQSKLLSYFNIAKEKVTAARNVVDNDLSQDWQGPEYDQVQSEIDSYATDCVKNIETLIDDTTSTFNEIKSNYETTSTHVKESVEYQG